MKRTLFILTALLVVGGYGCSAGNVYDALRFRQEIDCSKLHGSDRDECYRRSGMSYGDYQRQLKDRPQGP